MALIDFIPDIMRLTRQLFPTGRAFKMIPDGWSESLHRGLAISENKALNDAHAIQYAQLPDNDNFTTDDCSDWEARLGIPYSPLVPIADRKAAILRKMNHPGTTPERQHFTYLESQLRAAGFDVHVFENRFPSGGGYITRTAADVFGGSGTTQRRFGQFRFGQFRFGGVYSQLIANSIYQSIDGTFSVGDLRRTVFICGAVLGDPAMIPRVREYEFRQLVLKIKPVNEIAYIKIIYT